MAGLLGVAGCGGGGGGGGAGAAPVDTAGILAALSGFNDTFLHGDQAAAERFLAARHRGATAGSEVLTTIPLWDFGRDLRDASDNASFTFTVLADGIYQPSDDYAEVFAFYLSPGGTRFDVVFQMVKEEGAWYIDDLRLQTRSGGALTLAAYFPLHVGDRWKYAELRDGQVMPYYVVHTVESGPETTAGRAFYTVRETLEPRPGVSTVPAAGTPQGRFTLFGGTRRWSNEGGLWDAGPVPGSVYQLNNGAPLQLAPATAFVGSTTLPATAISEGFQGQTYVSQVEGFLTELPETQTAFGTFPAVSLLFSGVYKFNTAPSGPVQVVRQWIVKEGLGLLAYQEVDSVTAATVLKHELVEATVGGKTFNPAELPFRILTADPLPDGVPGVPYRLALEARWGVSPVSWSVDAGRLPPGLSLADTGSTAGTPTENGAFSVTLRATDARGRNDTRSFSLAVGTGLVLTDPSDLPRGRVGEAYRFPFQVQGSGGPFQWSIISQSVRPPGPTLDGGSGALAGTPTVAGEFLLQVQDTATRRRTYKTFALRILPAVAGGMTIRKAAFQTVTGAPLPDVVVEFADAWGQPILPDPDTLATDAFTVIDRLDPKAGGTGTVRTCHPSRVTFDGTRTRLSFAAGAFDLRSTTLHLGAAGLLSGDLTRTVATAPVPLANQTLFKKFVPWSAFQAAGLPGTPPLKIIGGETDRGCDLILLYPQGPFSTTVQAGPSLEPAQWSIGTGSLQAWFTDALTPADTFVDIFPGLNENTLERALFGLSEAGGVNQVFLQNQVDGPTAKVPIDTLVGGRFLAFRYRDYYTDAAGTNWYSFITVDGSSLSTMAFSDSWLYWMVRSSFAARITDLQVMGGYPDEFNNEITTIDDEGRIRQFSLDAEKRLTGGTVVDQVPGLTGGGHQFRLQWAGGQTDFQILDPGGHRVFQVTGGAIAWTLGGDAATIDQLGRFNGPFGMVGYPAGTTHGSWLIIADQDGLQIFENY